MVGSFALMELVVKAGVICFTRCRRSSGTVSHVMPLNPPITSDMGVLVKCSRLFGM